jgi:hypothetical protein
MEWAGGFLIMTKRRKSVRDITLDTRVVCEAVYPRPGTQKTIRNLKTVSFKLTRGQGIELARSLLVATKEWEKIDVKAERRPRKDGRYNVTVTSYK